jgi:hypothetical protein
MKEGSGTKRGEGRREEGEKEGGTSTGMLMTYSNVSSHDLFRFFRFSSGQIFSKSRYDEEYRNPG